MAQQTNDDMRAMKREWKAALVVLIGGFAIAIAVLAYFTLRPSSTPQPAAIATVPQSPDEARARVTNMAQGLIVCVSELASAENFGIIPPYTKLLNEPPKFTKVRGRYTCNATTGVARYTLVGDLVCRNLKDAHCMNLYSITRDDGTVMYQR